jgi:hypothetical protein
MTAATAASLRRRAASLLPVRCDGRATEQKLREETLICD